MPINSFEQVVEVLFLIYDVRGQKDLMLKMYNKSLYQSQYMLDSDWMKMIQTICARLALLRHQINEEEQVQLFIENCYPRSTAEATAQKHGYFITYEEARRVLTRYKTINKYYRAAIAKQKIKKFETLSNNGWRKPSYDNKPKGHEKINSIFMSDPNVEAFEQQLYVIKFENPSETEEIQSISDAIAEMKFGTPSSKAQDKLYKIDNAITQLKARMGYPFNDDDSESCNILKAMETRSQAYEEVDEAEDSEDILMESDEEIDLSWEYANVAVAAESQNGSCSIFTG